MKLSIAINLWMNDYIKAVQEQFGDRIWFVGLQGSYGRGEATDTSDIDVVLILDELSPRDVDSYSRLLDTLPNREMVCGFLSGKEEIEAWEKSDLFQFCYDTTPIIGSLESLMQTITPDDVMRAVKIGACNIYHACVHNLLHEKSVEILKSLYKSSRFVCQAIVYLQTGNYEKQQKKLTELLKSEERVIIENRQRLNNMDDILSEDFTRLSDTLIQWASAWIVKSKVCTTCRKPQGIFL